MRRLAIALALSMSVAPRASADERAAGLPAHGPTPEPIDETRRDVARLPVEAATITRADYAHGWFLEAQLGALTFAGDARPVSRAGPRFAAALGYELTQWLALVLAVDVSMHATKNEPPPSHTSFELVGSTLGARFTVPFGVRSSIWAEGLCGIAWSSGDVLRGLGFSDAFKVGIAYGGALGYDYHLPARHHAIGLSGGARMLPTLARDDFTLGAYGTGHLRYVF
jgi:hypothetical protein